jgi:hypothetical protein
MIDEMKRTAESAGIDFYTEKELEETQNKIGSTRYPNNYRSMKVKELLRKHKYIQTKKLIEEEIYILKYSFILFNNAEAYKIINKHEKELADYIMENKEEIMRVSMYDFIDTKINKYAKEGTA